MRIVHRITVSSTPEIRAELAAAGVSVATGGLVTTFEIDEADKSWPTIASWIQRRAPLDLVRTEFSRSEIGGAAWLELEPTWHYGYPQPDQESFGYRAATYDLTDWCETCGAGMRQRGPFQFKGEPRWGSHGLLQVNWVFDEFFATPHVWDAVFRPFGVGSRPVVGPNGEQLSTVVQLVIDETASVLTDGLPANQCPQCHRHIYLPVVRGAFPPLLDEPSGAIVKTNEYFGSGAQAQHAVLVRSDLAQSIKRNKVRGATLRPVQPERGAAS